MNIFVSNLSFDTTSESLKELFAAYGEIISANVISDKYTGFSRGFAFVEMVNETEGEKAIVKLSETKFEGNIINVKIARPKSDRSNGDWNNNRSTGSGYNRRRY